MTASSVIKAAIRNDTEKLPVISAPTRSHTKVINSVETLINNRAIKINFHGVAVLVNAGKNIVHGK